MSTENYLQIYDDNVVKFTIKQGNENDRWPISGDYKIDHSNSSTTYLKYENNDNIVERPSDTMPGSFTMAELACTRDTNRVFVGNFSDITGEQQKTVGGSIVGNKYLGFIDSKNLPTNSDATINGIPKPLSSTSNNGLLEDESDLRCYFHIKDPAVDAKKCEPTEDGKWPKQSYYNSKYDAYDGDYMYDLYRNALIIFDHNIKPSVANNNGEISGGSLPSQSSAKNTRHTTPLIPYKGGDASVEKFTADMYGDGYVLLYNVIPDGETLTFSEKTFVQNTGINSTNPGNYSQNIITLKDIPVDKIMEKLDSTYFKKAGNLITLQKVAGGDSEDNVPGDGENNEINIISSYSLGNIYNKVVSPKKIMASDANGRILEDSGISYDELKTLLDNTNNETGEDDEDYAKASDVIRLENLINDYHGNNARFTADLRIVQEITGETGTVEIEGLGTKEITYITPDTEGNINVDDFDSETKNGIISIVNNKTFIAPYNGTLYISVAKATATSTTAVNIHIVETDNLGDKPLCSILLNSAAGQSISASLIAGRKYKIYAHNAPNDAIPSVSTKVNSGTWLYSWICFEK